MSEQSASPKSLGRLVVLGSAGLTEGFSLIGAEVYPQADQAKVEQVLESLVREGAEALVLLETDLAHGEGHWLNRLRNEGGRILVTELPALSAPQDYTPAVDAVVRSVLGSEALSELERVTPAADALPDAH
ncbi:MAG: V-type ATP synthase subunit F [Thiobacillaceae bacterium]